MHKLHLLRHAKSSWKGNIADHHRRLTKRGRETAARIGKKIPGVIGEIDLVLCSSAMRTRETLEFVLARFPVKPPCLIEDALYLAERDKLLDRLRRLEEAVANVLMIGHNPGLHQLSLALAEPRSQIFSLLEKGKFPTLARASFEIETPWSAIGDGRHHLVDYATPASLDDN